LKRFICAQNEAEVFSGRYRSATIVNLDQGLTLIPFTVELFNEIITSSSSEHVGTFELLTENIEDEILTTIVNGRIAYIEAAYHGGEGGQSGIIWEQNKRVTQLEYGQTRINEVLQYFGVVSNNGEDEFASLRLGRYRSTQEWTE